MKRVVQSVLVGFLAALATPATASTVGPELFLNAPDGYGSCVFQQGCGQTVYGLPSYDSVYGAEEWSLGTQSQIGSISFFAGLEGPSTVTQVNWTLFSGLPSSTSVIASGLSTNFTTSPYAPVNGITTEQVTVDLSTLNLVLNPGYYTVAFHVDGSCCDTYLDQGLPASGAFESDNNGQTWTSGYYHTKYGPPYGSVAVEINGPAPTPLPSSLILMLSGLALLGAHIWASRIKGSA